MTERYQWVLAHTAQARIDYAFLNAAWQIVDFNPEITHWLDEPPATLRGLPLWEVFAEFIGLEDHLPIPGSETPLTIPRVQRILSDSEKIYFDLRVEAVDVFDARFLLTITDSTRPARLEQQLIQQRNELRLQIAARERAEEAFRQANDQLEARVAKRTAELQALSLRLVEIQETERRAIARELHDEIGQALTGLKLLLGMSARTVPQAAQPSLDEAQALVVDLMGQVRQLSLDLRPAMLDDLGLIPALLWHFERYTHQTGVQVDFKHTDLELRFSSDIETAAYRIIQEALTNVARHAGVDHVQVRLWLDGEWLCLRIADQGRGFNPEAVLTAGVSSGVSGMRERAFLLGGGSSIESAPGQGTQLTAQLPLREAVEKP